MRTEITSTPSRAAARLRAHAVRARRWLLGRAPATRWALVMAAVVAVGGLGYVATPVAPVGDYLYAGQTFGSDEIDTIKRELYAKHIKFHVDDQGRIEVASDQIDAATDAVSGLDVGPRSIPEIRERAHQSSFLTPSSETERRHAEAREKILETMIRNLDGIVWAYVKIDRPRPSGWARPAPGASAFVYLQTDRNREIKFETAQSIETILIGYEPALKRDAITVVDQDGTHYLDAGDPAVGATSRTRAREEELKRKVLVQLDWIKGVSVSVQLPKDAPPAESAPPPEAAPAPEAPVASASATALETAPPEPLIGLNSPLELDPEPKATPPPTPVSAPPPVVAKPEGQGGRGRIWVRVPLSFYRNRLKVEPSIAAPALAGRIEGLIRTAVELAVARDESWDVKIDAIPDDLPAADPFPIPATSPSRRPLPWWSLAGAVGVVAVMLLVAAYRAVVSRRPAPRRARGADRGRYPIDAASEPGHGPSERVRELVRYNPEAAAGVLQRWIGQGGHVG